MSDDFNNMETNLPPRDETDLSGMDMESAKEYVLAYMTTLKQTQRKITEIEAEAKIWEDRVTLAEQNGKFELKTQAEIRRDEILAKEKKLKAEESDLAYKVKTMLENLKKLKNEFAFSVDADRLLAELEMIVGEKDELADKFKEEETLSELEKLKRKMSGESGEPGNGSGE
ncbi:MAG: hypothetical protein JW969_14230 [Spirochaetales bacterium]|nr:hypothetical protein [Spirochaetales bacterium]